MPVLEYILLALLGSAASAPPATMLGADAIVQPNGGAMSVGQETPKKDGRIGNKKRTTNFTRHKQSRRPVRHPDTKKDGGKIT